MKTKVLPSTCPRGNLLRFLDIRINYPLVVRDNSCENTSKGVNDFFTSHGVKNYFSTSYEQWQNGLAESSVASVSILGKTGMAESGLGGRVWFCATQNCVICRNVTFKQIIVEKMYGIKKDVSKFNSSDAEGACT
jgi:hypothetical protein